MKAVAKDKRVELLFEVGCEEIPAGMLPKAEEELRINIEKLLSAESLSEGVTVETFSAPRRLTAARERTKIGDAVLRRARLPRWGAGVARSR